MHALAKKNTKTIRQNGNLRYLCLPSFVLRRSLNGTCETLCNTSPAGQGALFFYIIFCFLLLLHKTDICVYFNCFDTVPLHPQHLFSFLLCVCDWHCAEQNQKMNGEETQGIQKKLTSIWHVIDVKSVTFNDWPTFIYQMNFEFSQHSTEDFFTFQLFVLVVMPRALSKTLQNHNISENKLLKK